MPDLLGGSSPRPQRESTLLSLDQRSNSPNVVENFTHLPTSSFLHSQPLQSAASRRPVERSAATVSRKPRGQSGATTESPITVSPQGAATNLIRGAPPAGSKRHLEPVNEPRRIADGAPPGLKVQMTSSAGHASTAPPVSCTALFAIDASSPLQDSGTHDRCPATGARRAALVVRIRSLARAPVRSSRRLESRGEPVSRFELHAPPLNLRTSEPRVCSQPAAHGNRLVDFRQLVDRPHR